MNEKEKEERLCSCCCSIFIFGIILYFSVQFQIFLPYLNLNWEESECLVNSVRTYWFYWTKDINGNREYIYYSLIDVNINIEGRGIQGFACGCSEASVSFEKELSNNQYAWEYSVCQNPEDCENMLIQPAWYCTDCKECKRYLKQEKFKCRGMLKQGNNDISHPREIPEGYHLNFPTSDSTFIQVSLRDEVYYPEEDYIFFQVFGIGMLIFCPCLCVICCCIKWHTENHNQRQHAQVLPI